MKSKYTLTLLVCLFCINPILHTQVRTLNTSLPVGTTTGSFSVSDDGNANYHIPIVVPPGTGGMTPNISINYSSAAGNSLLGIGWTLDAVSAITRVQADFYHEGLNDAVDFDNYDRMALDGNRLVLISGTYGSAGSVYYTERESFVKITAVNYAAGGSPSLKIEAKDGRILEYGNTTNSRVEGTGRTDVLIWYLNKVTDASGNYMTYTYHNDKVNGEYWLERIDYTGNATNNLATYNYVLFNYLLRNDKSTSYIYGSNFQNNRYLSDITTYCEGIKVKQYKFNYTYDTYLHLKEIIEYGTDGTRYNSTLIDWYAQDNTYPTYTTTLPTTGGFCFDDFNGDGKTEVISMSTLKLYSLNSTGNDFSEIGFTGLPASSSFISGDFNGDGKSDIIKKSTSNTYSFSYYKSNGISFTSVGNFGPGGSTTSSLFPNDYNGDGISDVLVYHPETGKVYVSWGNASTPFTTRSEISITWRNKQFFYDFNGDGKTEIMTIDLSGYTIYEWEVNAFVLKWSNSSPTSNAELFMGDFNGDGKTDMIYGKAISGKLINLNSLISTGNGFISSSFGYDILDNIANLSVYDSDGDGKDELHHYYLSNGLIESWAYRFNNLTWSKVYGGEISGLPFDVYDFNGDGIDDYLCKSSSGDNKKILEYHTLGHLRHLVSSITNGVNNAVNISYKPLTDATVYTKYTNGSYPLIDFQKAGEVVAGVSYDNGKNGQNTVSYLYEGAKYDLRLRSFIGFSKVTCKDNTQGLKYAKEFVLNSTYGVLLPFKNLVQTISGSSVKETAYTPDIKAYANKRFWPYIKSSTTTDFLHANAIVNTNYQYDDYGNMTVYNVNSPYISATSTTNTYTTAGGWCPNRLLNTATIATRTGENYNTTSSSFLYYTNGLIKQVINEPGNTRQVYTNYLYDSYGNIIEVKTSPDGVTGRYTTYQYNAGSKGRMITKKLDSQGHFIEYTNNYSHGTVTQTKDHNNLTTKYAYDGFGRLTQSTSPDNNTSTSTLSWVTGGIPAYVQYAMVTSVPGSSPVKIYYDELGRAILHETTGFDNRKLLVETGYNNKGQVEYITLPYYEGDSKTDRKAFTYDAYGRILTETAPGVSLSYTYNGLTTTITDVIKSRSYIREANADGSLKKASDTGGDITYSYFANGLTREINALGATTKMTYDQFGRQTSILDPNSGTTTYTYNVYGELESQKDANANLLTMTYNNIGQVTTIKQPTFNTTYTYSANGLPQSVSATNNTTVNYGYDAYFRPSSVTEIVQGTTLGSSSEYDSYGRISTLTYPSGFKIKYVYKNGYLEEIKRNDNGASIWKLNSMNSKGQIIQSTSGNGLITIKTYNNLGYLTNIKTGNSTIQNIEYQYDTKGYLISRKDYRHNSKSETFGYDVLGRLFRINGITTVLYQNNGNITSKSDAGSYSYSAQHPNAVAGITGNSGTISSLQQNIGYTSFNKISNVSEGSNSATFTYGPDYERRKVETNVNGTITTRYYSGNFEREIKSSKTRELNYITAYGQIVAIFEKTSTSEVMHYVHTDHLGSVNVITSQAGAIEQELSYDAWGNRRDPNTWVNLTTPPANLITTRGFTGHEHMDEFKLINMNGRVYDPVLGRFLSADPFVADPTSTQDYNRYSYCVNNPLMFTDPSGYVKYEQPAIEFSAIFSGNSFFGRIGGGGDIGGPGYVRNGTGLNGVYYDWYSGTYRSTDAGNPVIGWSYAYNNSVIPNGFSYSGPDALGVAQDLLDGYKLYSYTYGGNKQYALLKAERNYSFRQLLKKGVNGLEGGATSIDYWILPTAVAQGYGGYSIDNAVNYLNEHANERSVHLCGKYVGLALQAGGIKGAMADGKDYGPILLKNGFHIENTKGYSPIKGDVTVIDGNASHKWGHVQMYNGEQWVSDFFQGWCSTKPGYEYGGKGFMVYSKDIPSLTIYRIGN